MPDRRDPSASPPADRDTLSLALRLLAKELRRRLVKHPQGHLVSVAGESVDLRLGLPTRHREGWLERARSEASEALDAALRDLLLQRAVFRPGRVYCLRCRSAECGHASPGGHAEVFAGYTRVGEPRFLDFGQWLLELQDPRVDQLYRSPPRLLARTSTGTQLTGDLLPAFRDLDSGYHIHGQVAAGWYRFPDGAGRSLPVAVTFQIVSARPRDSRPRFGLNLLGVGPGGQPLENLFDLAGELPWAAPAHWAQGVLEQVQRAAARRVGLKEELLEKRLDGLLNGLARRLERQRRAVQRRTDHGEKRHRERTRPTWKALADLEAAGQEDILLDHRRDTLIVLGSRGRAHVFNRAGKLVTSIRYSPFSIERRRKKGVWRPASGDDVGALKKLLELEDRAGGT